MIGTQISQYRLVEKLGEGGMGVVYKGVDVLLDRVVAVKLVSSELAANPELLERFKSEAKVQATLSHPNIATLYSYLIWEGRAVMVMEFKDQASFDAYVEHPAHKKWEEVYLPVRERSQTHDVTN